MRVVTLHESQLMFFSQKLALNVLSSGYRPDLIIGIKTGGAFVSEFLYDVLLNYDDNISYYEVSLKRHLSHKKQYLKVNYFLKYFPYIMLNLMRNLEVYLYELTKPSNYILNRQNDIIIREEDIKTTKNAKNILLVDDAIDSGATLLEVKAKISTINMNAQIKSAVLTSTHKSSYISADFTLFERVLLRCPWSNDYKVKR